MMMNLLFAAALALGASPSENRAAIQREIDAMSAAGVRACLPRQSAAVKGDL